MVSAWAKKVVDPAPLVRKVGQDHAIGNKHGRSENGVELCKTQDGPFQSNARKHRLFRDRKKDRKDTTVQPRRLKTKWRWWIDRQHPCRFGPEPDFKTDSAEKPS
jgi:hypothetical protein